MKNELIRVHETQLRTQKSMIYQRRSLIKLYRNGQHSLHSIIFCLAVKFPLYDFFCVHFIVVYYIITKHPPKKPTPIHILNRSIIFHKKIYFSQVGHPTFSSHWLFINYIYTHIPIKSIC